MQQGQDLNPGPSERDHVRGSLDAPVVITEFADFECPYCGQASPVLRSIEEKYGDDVAVVFRHFPLSMHPHAMDAAEAAEAAAQYGDFWKMHDELFAHQNALERSDLERYGAAAGVPEARVRSAIADKSYRERIEHDRSSGEDSGIPGTPALFINGFAFDEEIAVETLSAAIDRALAASRN